MKKTILLCLCFLSVNKTFSQNFNNKIYFLADTINTSKENRVLRIDAINPFEHVFTFYCICAYPYKNHVSFSYITKKGDKKSDILSEKPSVKYVSYRDLMDIINKYHKFFDDSYDLYITELLPNNKYRTNKVNFLGYRPPIENKVKLNGGQND